jgi:hypothetical protein
MDDDYPVSEERKCSFERHLKEWIDSGCKWFDSSKKPQNWNLEEQFKSAGIPIP